MGDREIRMPLSLGVTCLTDLAVGVIAVPVGVAVACVALALFYWAGTDAGDGNKLFLGILVVGGGTTFLGARAAFRAWRYRPSDLVISDTGFRIVGGRRHGFAADWSAVAKAQCHVKTSERTVITIRGLICALLESDLDEHFYRFHLDAELIAETDNRREADSFREIAAAMTERASPPSELELAREVVVAPPAVVAPAATGDRLSRKRERKRQRQYAATAADRAAKPVVATPDLAITKCDACGAPVAPIDAADVPCAYCAVKVSIPAELRERVRAAANLTVQAKRAERVVVKLLDQPSARETTAWVAASSVFIAAAWPVTVWAYVHLAHAHRLTFERGALIAALPFLLALDGFFLSRLRLVDRLALRLFALTFAARAPARDGDPPCCRACLGPLPALTTTVIACVYCGAANITRVDLRGRARRSELSAASLEHALVDHDRERLWWRLAMIIGGACFVATGAVLRHVLR